MIEIIKNDEEAIEIPPLNAYDKKQIEFQWEINFGRFHERFGRKSFCRPVPWGPLV